MVASVVICYWLLFCCEVFCLFIFRLFVHWSCETSVIRFKIFSFMARFVISLAYDLLMGCIETTVYKF